MAPAVVATLFVALGSTAGHAASASDWYRDENSAVRLIAARDGIGPSGAVDAGVELRLPEGWKTYWRSPGQAGIPTRFDWEASQNVTSATVAWPTPQHFSDFEMETYGYSGRVIFPVAVKAKDPAKAVKLVLRMTYGVCKEICMPVDARLVLDLPAETKPAATPYAQRIADFRRKVPGENGSEGLRIESLALKGQALLRRFEIVASSASDFGWPDVAVELPPAYRTGVPGVKLSMDRRKARISLPLWSNANAASLVGQTVSVTLWDEDGRAVRHDFIVAEPDDGSPDASSGQ